MTTTAATNLAHPHEQRPRLVTAAGWVWIAVLAGLFLWLFSTFFHRAFLIATSDNNWSHALVVPLISLYFIFQKRDALQAMAPRVCWWGLPILFAGIFSYAWWMYPGRNDMFRGYSMILSLLGLTLFVLGPRMMSILWFPILYLGFGVKIADKIWSAIAWHLQRYAAEGATLALKFIAVFMDRLVSVSYRGATIDITYMHHGTGIATRPLNVAEACSGLRMLMAFVALGVALAFLWRRPWWQRLVMVLLTVPVAIGVNIARVATIGVLFTYNQNMAAGEFHIFVGMMMLIPAAGVFLLLGWILDKIMVHDNAEGGPGAGGGSQHPAQASRAGGATAAGGAGEPERPRAWFRPRTLGMGLAVGAGLMLLVTGAYFLSIQVIAHDTLWAWTGGWLTVALLVGAVALVVGATVAMPRMVAAVGRKGLGRQAAVLAIATGVLLTAATTQASMIAFLRLKLIKAPVPMRRELLALPVRVGPWKFVRDDPPLSPEIVDALGTEKYITRWYKDTTWPKNKPGGLARVHIAYYTGKPSTVPHVPERCFVAGGLHPLDIGQCTLRLTGEGYQREPAHHDYTYPAKLHDPVRIPTKEFQARIFTFDAPGRTRTTQNVIYFFVANGRFLASPELVRLHASLNLRDKYSYYCKVEVQFPGVQKKKESRQRTSALLSKLMPEIMGCLPDWVQVKAGRYPTDVSGGG